MSPTLPAVMAGLAPAIHAFPSGTKNVDAGTRPGMTSLWDERGEGRTVSAATSQNFSFLNTASGSVLMISITRRHLPLT